MYFFLVYWCVLCVEYPSRAQSFSTLSLYSLVKPARGSNITNAIRLISFLHWLVNWSVHLLMNLSTSLHWVMLVSLRAFRKQLRSMHEYHKKDYRTVDRSWLSYQLVKECYIIYLPEMLLLNKLADILINPTMRKICIKIFCLKFWISYSLQN